MSSVSTKSGTSGQDDAVRAARDEYRKKENDLIKKHLSEIRALNDRYVHDNDEKDRANTKNLNDVRVKTQESLTKKDVKYQKEMENMRAMHTKQLEKLMQESRDKIEINNKSMNSELKQASLGKNDRVNDLNARYERQSADTSEKFSQELAALRAEQKEAMNKKREQLIESHDKELGAIHDERNETVSNLKNELRQVRTNTAERLKNQDVRHMQDKVRAESNHIETIEKETRAHNLIQEDTREGYQEGLKQVRNRMAKAREEDLQNQNSVNGDFKSSVDKRIDNQIDRLERELRSAKEEVVRSRIDSKRQADHELNNMKDAYGTKFEYLEDARKEMLNQNNQINSDNMKQIHSEANKQMAANTRYYQSRMETENFKNRDALQSQKSDFELHNKQIVQNTDNRIDNIVKDFNSKEKKIGENFTENIEVMKLGNEDEKNDIRMAMLKDKIETVTNLKDMVQKQELQQQAKLTETRANYEKRINELNDQFMREKRLRDNREKKLIADMKREHDTQVETLKIKYEDRNKQTNVAHQKELKDVSRRSQEQLMDVTNTLKKT
ncbi:MAG: hypothetical protein ABL927_00705 [Bdellovibrionales bacterium]